MNQGADDQHVLDEKVLEFELAKEPGTWSAEALAAQQHRVIKKGRDAEIMQSDLTKKYSSSMTVKPFC